MNTEISKLVENTKCLAEEVELTHGLSPASRSLFARTNSRIRDYYTWNGNLTRLGLFPLLLYSPEVNFSHDVPGFAAMLHRQRELLERELGEPARGPSVRRPRTAESAHPNSTIGRRAYPPAYTSAHPPSYPEPYPSPWTEKQTASRITSPNVDTPGRGVKVPEFFVKLLETAIVANSHTYAKAAKTMTITARTLQKLRQAGMTVDKSTFGLADGYIKAARDARPEAFENLE
jgi:hypothetical protein